MPIMLVIMPAAYAIGLMAGCGDAEKVVNCGVISLPWKRMKAPLLPICIAHAQLSRHAGELWPVLPSGSAVRLRALVTLSSASELRVIGEPIRRSR